MGLLQISDPHFGTEVPRVVAALTALTAKLSPSLVVMSGDVTQRATEDQFDSASAFLRRLPAPASLVVPGNHDIPLGNLAMRAFSPFARFMRTFGDDLEPVHEDADLLVIGVNTVMPLWHKQGRVSPAQVERTCALMRKASPKQIRAIVCHHPVHVIRKEDNKNLLGGADLILGGHIHLPYFRPLRQRLPDLPRDAWVVQAGTAVSIRIRQGIANSVYFVRPVAVETGAACRIERWDYSDREAAFRLIAADELTLAR